MLRDVRDHFNKGTTLLPGRMHVLENTTKVIHKGTLMSLTETFMRILTYLVNNLISV